MVRGSDPLITGENPPPKMDGPHLALQQPRPDVLRRKNQPTVTKLLEQWSLLPACTTILVLGYMPQHCEPLLDNSFLAKIHRHFAVPHILQGELE